MLIVLRTTTRKMIAQPKTYQGRTMRGFRLLMTCMMMLWAFGCLIEGYSVLFLVFFVASCLAYPRVTVERIR